MFDELCEFVRSKKNENPSMEVIQIRTRNTIINEFIAR
jgi:hypothetical protein